MTGCAEDQETVLQMLGVGIKVTLYGVRVEGDKWKFLLDMNEGTMADFFLEEDDEEDADKR